MSYILVITVLGTDLLVLALALRIALNDLRVAEQKAFSSGEPRAITDEHKARS